MSYKAMNHWRAIEEEKLRERVRELEEILTLVRDDLRMRSDDGVIDISDSIWKRLNKALEGKE